MSTDRTASRQSNRRKSRPATDATAEPADDGKPPAPGKPAKGGRRRQLRQDLLQELERVRSDLNLTLEHFTARVDGLLAGSIALLEGSEAAGEKAYTPKARVSQALIEDLRALSLRPERGRLKDLARIKQAAVAVDGTLREEN